MKLELFNFNGSEVRTITDEKGEPWFVAADVCRVLEIANSRDAIASLDDDEKDVATTDTLGGAQTVAIINESGLYSLVLRSRKPEAKAFKRWITHEVLPAIRKTGRYAVNNSPALPATFAEALRAYAAEVEAKEQLQLEAAMNQPKVDFFDAVAGSEDTLSMNDAVKVAKIGMGRNKALAVLRAEKIFRPNNTPYQEYIDRGYFKVVESKWVDSKGDNHITLSTRVFQRGVEFIRKKLAA